MIHLSSSAPCHPSLPMDTPLTLVEIEDVEIFGTSFMPIDGCGDGG
jgi:hypothetical protein